MDQQTCLAAIRSYRRLSPRLVAVVRAERPELDERAASDRLRRTFDALERDASRPDRAPLASINDLLDRVLAAVGSEPLSSTYIM